MAGGAALPSLNNSKSFSNGVKFKSKHKTLLLFDFFTIGAIPTGSLDKLKGSCWWLFSLKPALCLLICPPKACPIANSSPQMEHSCVLGLAGGWFSMPPSPSVNLGFLWLARWPPRAWNEGNCRLHVLHSKTRLGILLSMTCSYLFPPPCERSIKQFARAKLFSTSDLSEKLLFMV
ncbi:Uncharacterized protein TCM_042836 [Theobroma cacao]|uniref:Uncharacterized protein n=1 Tax=Theobroma cacao TaxID=3641 RepID=A0A061FMG5_THECC|nr:Uncharacterized protein TCM_042836 [Theobroma cacao]